MQITYKIWKVKDVWNKLFVTYEKCWKYLKKTKVLGSVPNSP